MVKVPRRTGSAPGSRRRQTVRARRVLDVLAGQYPNADTELRFRDAFELLVATILSAQCTDERVNAVTPEVFRRYPDARALAAAEPAELESLIRPTGFFRSKARALLGMARMVVDEHAGTIPASMAALVRLPGVGRKTANVVLGHALGIPGLPVDRHVLRVSQRLGLIETDDPVDAEHALGALFPAAGWVRVSDTLILHGRRICKPRPRCDRCPVQDDCPAAVSAERPAAVAPGRGRRRAGPRA